MNGRQAAKMAGQRVMELERILALNKADIVNYNLCILSMIDGKSPCDWCEDQQECQLQAKGGTGCEEWMLRMPRPENGGAVDEAASGIEPVDNAAG